MRHSFRTANQNYVITADDQPDELFVEKLRPVLERRYAKRGLTVDFADPHFSPAHQVYGPTSKPLFTNFEIRPRRVNTT